jgi:hypothetical protein
MIGGAPIFMPSAVPPAVFPAPGMMPPGYAPPRPTYPQRPVAQAPARQPIVRGSRPDEASRPATPVRIPSPEELGVAPVRTKEATVDWPGVHQRLRELKAVGYYSECLSAGRYRFRCWLPRSSGGNELVEAHGNTEAEAIRLGLTSASRAQADAR